MFAALSSGQSTVLAGGNDFYSNPRLDKDGARLAWVTWNHPNMPWCVTAKPELLSSAAFVLLISQQLR